MRNWSRYVRGNLSLPQLKREREDKIIEDLAGQLEDFYREARARGDSEDDADRFAREQIPSMAELAGDLNRAEWPNRKPRIDRWVERTEADAGRGAGSGSASTG